MKKNESHSSSISDVIDSLICTKGLISEKLLAVNMLTSPKNNRENLPLPIQIKLSEKKKKGETLSDLFITFLESALNFQHFEKKISLIPQVVLKLLASKDLLS